MVAGWSHDITGYIMRLRLRLSSWVKAEAASFLHLRVDARAVWPAPRTVFEQARHCFVAAPQRTHPGACVRKCAPIDTRTHYTCRNMHPMRAGTRTTRLFLQAGGTLQEDLQLRLA